MGPAIDVLPADHMVSGLDEPKYSVDSRHPRSEGKPVRRTFERGDVALQRVTRRVTRSGILEAEMPSECGLYVGRRLENRGHDRAGDLVRHLSGVHCTRAKPRCEVFVEYACHRNRGVKVAGS